MDKKQTNKQKPLLVIFPEQHDWNLVFDSLLIQMFNLSSKYEAKNKDKMKI